MITVTEAQMRWLLRADSAGLIGHRGANGLSRFAFHQVMNRLVSLGLVIPYPHDEEYELTAAGRELLNHDEAVRKAIP